MYGDTIMICEDCKSDMPLQVLRSNAGYYIGYSCKNCGPYSRESGYYRNREDAEKDLRFYKDI